LRADRRAVLPVAILVPTGVREAIDRSAVRRWSSMISPRKEALPMNDPAVVRVTGV
jgi:hypothetical protein